MDLMKTVLLILGASFLGVGLLVTIVFAGVGGMGVFIAIPIFFVVLGLCFVIGVVRMNLAQKEILKKGTRYAAKIYSYVPNTSVVVNGEFTMNVKVHYFDRNGLEREAIIPTGFSKGSNAYPIGMTMDIFEYQGKYGFDPASVRNEILPREEELMDDKPIDPSLIKMVAVECKNCGSTYEAITGYSAKCPYCGTHVNA